VRIAYCTTCKGRADHLRRTLPANIADNPKSIFIVLDYSSQDDLQDILRSYRTRPWYDRLFVYQYRTEGPFRMAHAKNMAHRLGIVHGADVLVNVDADNFLHKGFEDFIEETMRTDTFLWAGTVKGKGRRFRGVSGRIACTAAAFIKTGGYDEIKFDHWGHDDTDFNQRLRFLGYKPVEIPLKYLECIPHGDGMRFQDYPDAKPADPNAYDTPPPSPGCGIVNYGNIGCGTVFRQDGPRLELKPIPTRIFGIGLHKTATTSLHAALRILGYESAHWESGPWARDVWQEMTGLGRSPTLERFYAASDLPISIVFKELDHAYPGSKFILTIRDEGDWLRSVENHFSYKNPYRWEWDVYPFPNRMHRAVYGRKTFDATTMLERYRRHNAEVQEYFKARPNDLLVMRQPLWSRLCRFLDKPVPTVPYPWAFATAHEYGPFEVKHWIGRK
jgi:Sulfotransferase domain